MVVDLLTISPSVIVTDVVSCALRQFGLGCCECTRHYKVARSFELISACNYTASGKMLALMNRILDWFRSLFWKEEMELTLVGLQYSGKTTFVNVIAVSPSKFFNTLLNPSTKHSNNSCFHLQSGQFSEDMIPTVGFNMRKITKGNVTIKVWDIGGQPRFRSMWERYCRGVNAIV